MTMINRVFALVKIFKRKMLVNYAFTLAEVLITLGIIGVVAALTIPVLVENHRAAEFRTRLNTAYSLIGQAMERMRADDLSTLPDDYTAKLFVYSFSKYFELGDEIITSSPTQKQYNYKTYNNKVAIDYPILDDGMFGLKNGMYIFIENPGMSLFGFKIGIFVDINGPQKNPNLLGHDLFAFQLLNDGFLKPMGSDGTAYDVEKYCSKTSTESLNGIACTYKALTEPDYFKKLP